MKITPNGWREFQHYKDRNPPWIRLHRKLLDNKDFHRLPVASRALAPMLWLLASESMSGEIDADPDDLAFRLRSTEKEMAAALKPLIDKGFFVVVQDASAALADCGQVAVPETEALQRQGITETEAEKPAARPLTFQDLALDGVSEEAANEWFAVRKKKRAVPLSALAWSSFKTQATQAGWDLEAAVRKCGQRNWITFEAEWVGGDDRRSAPRDQPKSFAERDHDATAARIHSMTGGLLNSKPKPVTDFIDMEETHAVRAIR